MHSSAEQLPVPVTFDCEGSRLMGSLHEAPAGFSSVGVILLNQGALDRGGGHRLSIKLARRLNALGVPVLRFDARGVGESEGHWGEEGEPVSVADVGARIMQGAWKPDAHAAIEFMLGVPGVQRVILGGVCGGAVTALLAGVDHPAVEGMFAIGTPVTFSAVTGRVADLPDAIIERDVASYLGKIFRPSAWWRLLSLKTDYRTLANVFAAKVARQLRPKGDGAGPAIADDKVNGPLFEAIQKSRHLGKRQLLVFGENDYLWQEFKEHLPRFGSDPRRFPFDLVTIPDANHTLTDESWQQALYDAVADWVQPVTARAARTA